MSESNPAHRRAMIRWHIADHLRTINSLLTPETFHMGWTEQEMAEARAHFDRSLHSACQRFDEEMQTIEKESANK